jgi:hypothetical protein
MPRPINYIVKLRKWAKETNGDIGLKLALLNTLNLAKTIKNVSKEEDDDISQIDEYLKDVEDYLESSLEN